MTNTAYTNAIIFTGKEQLSNHAIITKEGTIADIIFQNDIPEHYDIVDLEGLNIAPAFIDLQIYGGNGKLFAQEISAETIQSTYEYCLSGGAAHFMITMATNSIEVFLKGIEMVRLYQESGGKGCLGLHLEGPYINPVKRGAHIEKFIHRPRTDEVKMLLENGTGIVRMMTLAPEECDDEIISLLLKNNVIVSAGHTNAEYRQGMAAFDNGIPAATHLFNAMSAFQHRAPGMVGAVYDHPSPLTSVVCDGIHVDFAAVRVSKKLLGDRLFYITDAVTEVHEGPYQHVFRGDRYTLPDGTLSGSCLTMMQCVRNGVEQVGISLEESLRMASTYPARLLGPAPALGKIERGCDASFVVFDDRFSIKRTITGSK